MRVTERFKSGGIPETSSEVLSRTAINTGFILVEEDTLLNHQRGTLPETGEVFLSGVTGRRLRTLRRNRFP